MKCAVLFRSVKGQKFEKEINEWLEQNPNVNIKHVAGVDSYLLIFYEN